MIYNSQQLKVSTQQQTQKNQKCQTLLFSATFPTNVLQFAMKIIKEPKDIILIDKSQENPDHLVSTVQ